MLPLIKVVAPMRSVEWRLLLSSDAWPKNFI